MIDEVKLAERMRQFYEEAKNKEDIQYFKGMNDMFIAMINTILEMINEK